MNGNMAELTASIPQPLDFVTSMTCTSARPERNCSGVRTKTGYHPPQKKDRTSDLDQTRRADADIRNRIQRLQKPDTIEMSDPNKEN